MAIELPELPYAKEALAPHMSAETLEFHYGKHHAGYVTKLNAAIEEDSSLAGKSLDDLVRDQTGSVFNNAAQIWNHTCYWNSLSPNGGAVNQTEIVVSDAVPDGLPKRALNVLQVLAEPRWRRWCGGTGLRNAGDKRAQRFKFE